MSRTQGLKRISGSTATRRHRPAWQGTLLGLGLLASLGTGAQAAGTPQAAKPASRNAAKPPAAPASVPTVAPEQTKPAVQNSYLDGPLLYQLLLAELALRENQPGDAVELVLEAARHNKDDTLFRRALQIAVEAGAGDKALSITKAWRQTMPRSVEAVLTQVQLLFELDRVADTAEPLYQLLDMSPPSERAALIAGLPRAARRAHDQAAAAEQFRILLQPYMDAPETRVAAHVALGRMRLAEGRVGAALELAAQAQALDPQALPPALLALDVMNGAADAAPQAKTAATVTAAPAPAAPADTAASAANLARAETVVRTYLETPGAEPLVRQAFAGVLAGQQRLSDASDQLRIAAQARPGNAQLWLGLGEVELELHHPEEAETALKQALALVTGDQAARAKAAQAAAQSDGADSDSDSDDKGVAGAVGTADDASAESPPGATPPPPDGDSNGPVRLAQVQLLLARAADQRHDTAAAAQWLAQVDAKDADLQVISLRASLLARQGKLADALAMLRGAPATTPNEQRYKLLAEVQLLLDQNKLAEARGLLADANAATPGDVDLLYQEAMVDERLDKLDDMERLLRAILALQPDNSQALNALGYSLADRNVRLDEAFAFVKQAHDLAPNDPFIADSLGWVEYRLGHFAAATALLNQAFSSRHDTEIAAHLGEVLWAEGQHDEATKVLRDAHKLDAANDVLKQTMARLKVSP